MAIRNFAVVDIEATCVQGDRDVQSRFKKETIELPVVVIKCDADGQWLRNEDGSLEQLEFRTFVKPVRNPVLSDFCKELTGIQQHQVADPAPTFSAAFASLDCWLADNDITAQNSLFVSCGDFDLKHIRAEAALTPGFVPGPTLSRLWDRFCNVKLPFVEHLKRIAVERGAPAHEVDKIERRDMAEMLEALGLPLVGRHHSGIDDARNIARIASVIGADALRANGGFDASGRFQRVG
jgi:inhibitor of KinA sporulation pathway (predicted exonuclease)